MPAGAFAFLIAVALSQAPAPEPSSEAERFKRLVLGGEAAFSEGDLGIAAWAFREADRIRATPEVAFNLSKTHEALGDGAMAAYWYRLYLRRAPDAQDAVEVAGWLGEILSRAETEGRGLVEVEAPARGSVSLSGRTFVELPAAAFLPPGEHLISAEVSGERSRRQVSLLTGRIASVQLEPFPPPLLDAEGRQHPLSMAKSSGGSGASIRTVLNRSSLVLAGLSAVALAAGTAFGASSAADAERATGPQRSLLTVSEAQAQARLAEEKGARANGLWAAGGAGLLLGGAVFVFTLPEGGGR